MTVHQLVASMAVGAATTNDVLALQAQFGGHGTSHVGVLAETSGSGLEHLCSTWASVASSATPHDTLVIHSGVLGPPLPDIAAWPGRVVARVHDPGPRQSEYDTAKTAAIRISTSVFGADSLARRIGGPVHVVAPLLPLDGFLAVQHDVSVPAILLDEPIADGCTTISGVLVAHLMRTHLVPRTRLDRLGPIFDQARAEGIALLCEQLRLSVQWLGVVPHPVVLATYASASLLLVGGSTFPAGAVNAMAAGVPIVGRGSAIVREVVGEAGLLVDPLDDDAVLAEAAAEVMGSPTLAAELVAAGRDRVGRFAPQFGAARIHELLQE